MSSFTDALEIKGGGSYVEIQRPLRFYINDNKVGEYVEVYTGFCSNGASIPKAIQKLFGWSPFDHRWLAAAIIHDALVGETVSQFTVRSTEHDCTRYLSWSESATWFDAALRVKMSQHNIRKFKRKMFVAAVRAWGLVRG
jgi:hypothetical protein